ncbi:MAG: hypothetical protein H0T48_17195 [Gemmatimonadaceae bacterium]|nr:hypothetical protein [Gemmatimonadaceae bacterium]
MPYAPHVRLDPDAESLPVPGAGEGVEPPNPVDSVGSVADPTATVSTSGG